MPRGGRALSARSDDDMEVDTMSEVELQKLDRQLRLMKKDSYAYSQESQRIIAKQR